jgi:hypothetical protein
LSSPVFFSFPYTPGRGLKAAGPTGPEPRTGGSGIYIRYRYFSAAAAGLLQKRQKNLGKRPGRSVKSLGRRW